MKAAKVHIAAFFSMLFWGFSYVWSKIVFEFYTPLTTIFLRLSISFVALFLFIFISKRVEKIKQKDYWMFAVSSLFNPFLYFMFESYGLLQVPASTSAFIIATIPVFTPFVGYWVFKEKLSVINVAGLTISFLGVAMIILNPDLSFAATPYGILLLFLAVISAIVYTVFLKKLVHNYKPLTVIAWQNMIGTVYFLPFFLYLDVPQILTVVPSVEAIISLVLLGLFASCFAYAMFAYVIKYLGISKGNIYANLIPVFAALAAYFMLNEEFTILKIIGMSVIIIGVTLSVIERKKVN